MKRIEQKGKRDREDGEDEKEMKRLGNDVDNDGEEEKQGRMEMRKNRQQKRETNK